MAFLRLCTFGLVIVVGVTFAACSSMQCKSDSPPVYSTAGKPDQGPHQDEHK
jgi:hypothetical protein